MGGEKNGKGIRKPGLLKKIARLYSFGRRKLAELQI
jgi:hypothetical protein